MELELSENLGQYDITKPPSKFIFCSGNENKDWIIEISCEEGIKFNREAFPNSQPDDFAEAFIKILEMNYTVRFDKK